MQNTIILILNEERIINMNKEVLSYAMEKTKELINVPFCDSKVKAAAQSWLESVGTEKETDETKKYIAELEDGILSIDSAIAFAESDKGIQILGDEQAKNVAAHSRKRKSDGEKYCGCDACLTAAEILKAITE